MGSYQDGTGGQECDVTSSADPVVSGMVCVLYNYSRQVKPLTPIPMSTGPFDRVGVDVLHFPKSVNSWQPNMHAVQVFVDYIIITKWPEVFATIATDQSALTIAKLLVVSRRMECQLSCCHTVGQHSCPCC